MKKTMRAACAARTLLVCGQDVLASPGMRREKTIPQHGVTNVYWHSVNVAYMSLYLAKKLGVAVDERALVRGALLHDYFLYDWHDRAPDHRLHGFYHPRRALDNAKRAFELSETEQNVILRHMFPLCPTPPGTAEGWLVCFADKVCAVLETFRCRTMSERLRAAIEGRIARL